MTIQKQFRDNLFNADHRRLMIETYGTTEAEWITVEKLQNRYDLDYYQTRQDL